MKKIIGQFQSIDIEKIVKINFITCTIDFKPFNMAGYFTAIPISPKRWRINHATLANIVYEENASQIEFSILDDWGKPYSLVLYKIDENKEIIEKLKEEIKWNFS